MKKAGALLLVVMLVALHAAQAVGAERTLRFTGKTVQEEAGGITILGRKDRGLLAVTSTRFHYALILPYAENWVFTLDDSSLLRGNSGLVNLTLSAFETDKKPAQFLEGYKKRLEQSERVKGVEKSEIITVNNEPVFRNVVDGEIVGGSAEFRGVKIVHFFGAKRRDSVIYLLHLSRVVPPKERESFKEKTFLDMVTAGFQVDFMKDEGAK